MQKAYDWEENYWENKPSTKTPVNKTNLDKLSNATRTIDERVITLDLTKLSKIEANGMITGITLNQDTGDITITYYSGASSVLHTLMAQIAINFGYDPVTERLIIYLKDGSEQYIDLSALITQFEFLDSDTVYWSIGDDGKVKADIKNGSITADKLQPNYLADITVQAETATQQASAAASSVCWVGVMLCSVFRHSASKISSYMKMGASMRKARATASLVRASMRRMVSSVFI